ncbi:YbfB/YjiJ family MFS transporter [Ramlibacter sp. USB13]|uniref:YbfB/YjiJ family MFS transporter n=1 Tax=Ramlibacter cellulosilyticus TaxID=2764187 RepID=A0A923SD52_9BURK|nr:YbfB/YjiJ family MFS transporter [Ramlibacter cellulosilyticus]MBC5785666.1 YbfB/YjiJ family MFS transporter [Ramlibacter cellulosilyticus]
MSKPPPPPALALAGLLSLAVAMGIGRFAFTPLLPLMAREGQLDLALGGWIAAANYAGYFAGALTAARLPLAPRTLGALALALTAATTAAMAWPDAAAWMALRFLAGAASAWVFVATSVWCLGALARQGRGDLGGIVYAGVGCGIALTGVYCLLAAAWSLPASTLWIHLGALSLLLALPAVGTSLRVANVQAPRRANAVPLRAPGGTHGLVACYGLMGFGYILPATFLPALARGVVDDPRLFGLAWPVFGATAALSTVLAGWWMRRASRLQAWAASQLLMGVGVLLPSLWVNGATIALSALLVGGTFMVITLAGVQEMRSRAPDDAVRWVGRITAAFALGQIAGPVLSALLLQTPVFASRGLALALQAAALALLASGAWLWRRASPTTSQETVHA